MNTQKQLDTILSNTYTKSDFYHRLAVCKSFLEHWFYTEHEDVSMLALLKTFSEEQEEEARVANALEKWGTEFYEVFTKETFYDAMAQLEEAAMQLPILTLYIPTNLPPEDLDGIGSWVRKSVEKRALISISIDPHVAGGCAFLWHGRYYDFSFSHFLRKRHDEVVTVIRSYADTNGS